MTVDADTADAFYELESHVRDLGRRAHRPPGALPATREIFVPVTGPVPATDRIEYQRLMSGARRPSSPAVARQWN